MTRSEEAELLLVASCLMGALNEMIYTFEQPRFGDAYPECLHRSREALAAGMTVLNRPARKEERTVSAVDDLEDFAKAVTALAFKMPPPNEWTPQFVMLAQAVERIAFEHRAQHRKPLSSMSREPVEG